MPGLALPQSLLLPAADDVDGRCSMSSHLLCASAQSLPRFKSPPPCAAVCFFLSFCAAVAADPDTHSDARLHAPLVPIAGPSHFVCRRLAAVARHRASNITQNLCHCMPLISYRG